jgi:hypothetical protein
MNDTQIIAPSDTGTCANCGGEIEKSPAGRWFHTEPWRRRCDGARTLAHPSEAERARADQLDALGAALVDARRHLTHGGHIIEALDLDGARLDLHAAVSCVDELTQLVQRERNS